MSQLKFVVGKSHFTMLGSQKAAPEAVRVSDVPDNQILDVTLTMPAKGTEKEFIRAIRKAKGRELTRADVANIKLATSLVKAALQAKTSVVVSDAEARKTIEAAQWNCVKLRQALGLAPKQFKAISAAVQSSRAALNAAKGYKFSNQEIIALQDGTPAHRAKMLRALRKDGATRVQRSVVDRMHGEQRVKVSYAIVRDKWNIKLAVYRDKDGNEFVDSDGSALTLPNYYFGAVNGLHGLRSRAHAHTNYVVHPEPTDGKVAPHATSSAFPARATMFEIARMQGFPVDAWVKSDNKSAQLYLSLGGDNGTKTRADAAAMCKAVGIRVPNFFNIPSDGTDIEGDYSDGATVENALDLQDICALGIEYAGVIACANTSNSFAGGFQTFVATDTFNVDGVEIEIDTLSCSWGMAEDNTSQQDLARLQRIGVNAMLKHKIVTCATGDNGSKDSTDHATPDAPSSVVGFIGLAGVFIDTADGKTINVIKVWFDGSSGTGGGISKFFPQMDQEKQYNLPVSKSTGNHGHSASLFADDADPASGAFIFYNGKWMRVGGTSSAAPSTAAKLKKMQMELHNRIPNVIFFAYAHFGDGICAQVTAAGSNDDYDANPGDKMNVPLGGGVIIYDGFMMVARQVQDGIAA